MERSTGAAWSHDSCRLTADATAPSIRPISAAAAAIAIRTMVDAATAATASWPPAELAGRRRGAGEPPKLPPPYLLALLTSKPAGSSTLLPRRQEPPPTAGRNVAKSAPPPGPASTGRNGSGRPERGGARVAAVGPRIARLRLPAETPMTAETRPRKMACGAARRVVRQPAAGDIAIHPEADSSEGPRSK